MAKQFNTTTILTNQAARNRLMKRLAPFAVRYHTATDAAGMNAVVEDLNRLAMCRSVEGYGIMLGAMISLVAAYAPPGVAVAA